jgi:hypothetical protein
MFARAFLTMLCARASVPEGPELEEDFDAPAVAGFALDDALCTGASATLDAQTPIVCSLTLEGYFGRQLWLFPTIIIYSHISNQCELHNFDSFEVYPRSVCGHTRE